MECRAGVNHFPPEGWGEITRDSFKETYIQIICEPVLPCFKSELDINC